MSEKVKIEISTFTIVKVFLVLLAIYFVYFVRDIIVLFFVVLILAASLRPVVSAWEKKIKRLPSVILLVIIFASALSIITYLIIPPVITQIKQLVNSLPDFINRYELFKSVSPSIEEGAGSISKNIGGITGGIWSIASGVFGGFLAFMSVVIMTVYLLLDEKDTSKFFLSLVHQDQREQAQALVRKISNKVGDWFRGQMILCSTIGVFVWLGLIILGIPYALILAILAGIFEIIPTIGPIISGTIATLIALQVSPLAALLVVILFVVLNQIENSILVPKIMQKAVGLSPIIVILAVLTGAKTLGATGAVLAVPVAAIVWVVIQEWPQIKETFGK